MNGRVIERGTVSFAPLDQVPVGKRADKEGGQAKKCRDIVIRLCVIPLDN